MSKDDIAVVPKLRINTDSSGRIIIQYKNNHNLFSSWVTLKRDDDYYYDGEYYYESMESAKKALSVFKNKYGVEDHDDV